MEKCSLLFPDRQMDIQDREGCIKPRGHLDMHLFQNKDGRLIEWEEDYECTCGCWDEEGYACILYNEMTAKK